MLRLIDSLIRLQNGSFSGLKEVFVLKGRGVRSVLSLLTKEGYIRGVVDVGSGYRVCLIPKRLRIKLFSTPGYAKHVGYRVLYKWYGVGSRTIVVSTNKGIVTVDYLVLNKIKEGGKLLFEISLVW